MRRYPEPLMKISRYPVPVAVIGEDGGVLAWNPAMALRTGLGQEQALGRKWTACIPNLDRESAETVLSSVFAAPERISGTERVLPMKKKGSEIPAFWLVSFFAPETGAGYGVLTLDGDQNLDLIRDRIHAHLQWMEERRERITIESRWRESQRRLNSLLQHSPDFIMNVDREGRIRYINRPLPGLSLRDVIGLSYEKFTDSHYHEIFGNTIRRVFRTGEPDSLESTGEDRDGRTAWYEVRFGPVIQDEKVESVMLIVTNITARKNAEAAISRSESRYRLLAENMTDFVWTVNADMQFMYVSPSVTALLGFPVDEVMKFSWLDLFSEESRETLADALGDLPMQTGKHKKFTSLDLQLRMRTREGAGLWTETRLSFMFDASGAPVGLLGISRDITDRKRAEEDLKRLNGELEQSNQDLEQFAYIVSHDLQQPLRMVSEFVTLLDRRYGEGLNQEAKEFIGYAVNGARRMQALIRDLLLFSRVGRQVRSDERIDLASVIGEVTGDLCWLLDESGGKIVRGELPTVTADRTLLRQVFQNLIGNAVKFRSGEPPVIQIGAEKSEREWVIWVRDNGIGMEEIHRERIFQIFQRLHTDDDYPGNGIGLSICKRIVERQGGRIWVESEPGRGSCFYFTLPDGNRLNRVA